MQMTEGRHEWTSGGRGDTGHCEVLNKGEAQLKIKWRLQSLAREVSFKDLKRNYMYLFMRGLLL